MPNLYRLLLGEGKTEKQDTYEVEGMFQCNRCQRTVWSGNYDPNNRVIRYTCVKGHVTEVEDWEPVDVREG